MSQKKQQVRVYGLFSCSCLLYRPLHLKMKTLCMWGGYGSAGPPIWMSLYPAIVAVVCLLMLAPLKMAFMANWGFNLLILAALVTGIALNMRHVVALEPE